MKGLIYIGSSNNQVKILDVDKNLQNKTYNIDKNNWICHSKCDNECNDRFTITINNGVCKCQRLDTNTGWGLELLINVDLIETKDIDEIGVFFINLAHRKDRLEEMQNLLSKIFSKNIYRVEGVKHKYGMIGCRLAHIKAHITAINKGYNHYIIAEDDISPLVNINLIEKYIMDSINFNPDLVLFEQGCNLEKKIKLKRLSDNMYRIYSGGNNAGMYLSNKNFGIKLIKIWIKRPLAHADWTWQFLWEDNKVYFHRPQLFHQKASYSDNSGREFVEETPPFDWKEYERNQLPQLEF